MTGANGQLGRAFRRRAGASSDHYIFTDITSDPTLDTVWLDVTNPDAIQLICASERVDIIINCAAFTDVDKAEQDLRMAELLNRVAPGYLADIARERNALLIHFSTDRIFRGEIPIPIREDFPAAPSGAFGVTKLQGEEAIRNSGCRSVIIRTSWLYSPEGDNFMTRMKGLTMQRKKLKVVYDQVGSPTRAADLADAVCRIIETRQTDKTGVYHYADEGVCSRYDFACAVRDLSGSDCNILPIRSSEYPSAASRPHYSVLDKTLFKTTFGIAIPHWYASLKDCLEKR